MSPVVERVIDFLDQIVEDEDAGVVWPVVAESLARQLRADFTEEEGWS